MEGEESKVENVGSSLTDLSEEIQGGQEEEIPLPDPSSIKCVTSSQYPIPPELTDFLKKNMTGSPFNKYCIDCKRNKTTHALIWLGIFVCEGCSIQHLNLPNGCQSRMFVKDALKEHWDDYQLRSI